MKEEEVDYPDYEQIEDALRDSDFNDAIMITWESIGEEHHEYHVQPVTTSNYRKENGFMYGKLVEKLERAIHQLKVEQIAEEVKHKMKNEVIDKL